LEHDLFGKPEVHFSGSCSKGRTGAASFASLTSRSAAEGNAALIFGFLRRFRIGRQLQNRRLLAFAQQCQQHDSTIGKFQRIVMRRCFLLVNLPENRGPVIDHAVTPQQQAGWDQPHLTVEREFGTWQNADGEIGVLDVVSLSPTAAGRDLTW
jgi:hypothetical protein